MGFCWYITKLSLRKLIVACRLINHKFYNQFLNWLLQMVESQLSDIVNTIHLSLSQDYLFFLAEWKTYSVNYIAQLTFYHLQKLVLVNIFNVSWLGSHLDFPEYILMALSYKFIRNTELAIKDKERYFSNLGKSLLEEGWEFNFKQN